jgi:hypothetical protein
MSSRTNWRRCSQKRKRLAEKVRIGFSFLWGMIMSSDFLKAWLCLTLFLVALFFVCRFVIHAAVVSLGYSAFGLAQKSCLFAIWFLSGMSAFGFVSRRMITKCSKARQPSWARIVTGWTIFVVLTAPLCGYFGIVAYAIACIIQGHGDHIENQTANITVLIIIIASWFFIGLFVFCFVMNHVVSKSLLRSGPIPPHANGTPPKPP